MARINCRIYQDLHNYFGEERAFCGFSNHGWIVVLGYVGVHRAVKNLFVQPEPSSQFAAYSFMV